LWGEKDALVDEDLGVQDDDDDEASGGPPYLTLRLEENSSVVFTTDIFVVL
jgi:hypothetical protein